MKQITVCEEEALMRGLCQVFGTQRNVAKALDVSQQRFNYWLNVAKKRPYEKVLEMQELYEKMQPKKSRAKHPVVM